MTVPTLPELVAALPVIGSLVVIEGLLSVDNALAIAALAGRLPVAQRRRALTFGMIGAYAFRVVALCLASWVIGNAWVKGIGALYLIYLMVSELRSGGKEMSLQAKGVAHFWPIFFAIQWIDLTLSFDNVVAAVALSPKLWIVCTGVLLGMIVLRFLAGACIALLERFPVLRPTAFILVGYVGALLLYEVAAGREVGVAWKCGGIALILAAAFIVPGSSRAARRRRKESSR